MRFEGKTEIDWFSTSRPHRCSNLDVCDEFKLSDHKIVSLEMLTSAKPAQRFRFCPQPKWNKPSFLQMDQWQELLQLAWKKLANETCKPLMRLDPSEINVDLEWTNYMTLLSHTYRDATVLAESKATEPAHFAEIHRALRQTRAKHGKGIQPPKVQPVQKEIKTAGHSRANMADRKLAKKLARLHEFNRLARLAIQHSNAHFLEDCSENLQILAKKICIREVSPSTALGQMMRTANLEITQLQADRVRNEQDSQSQRLQFWKTKMQTGDAKTISINQQMVARQRKPYDKCQHQKTKPSCTKQCTSCQIHL